MEDIVEGYRYWSKYYIHLIFLENEGVFPQEELSWSWITVREIKKKKKAETFMNRWRSIQ